MGLDTYLEAKRYVIPYFAQTEPMAAPLARPSVLSLKEGQAHWGHNVTPAQLRLAPKQAIVKARTKTGADKPKVSIRLRQPFSHSDVGRNEIHDARSVPHVPYRLDAHAINSGKITKGDQRPLALVHLKIRP